jgi:methylenetetrahydrofolate dehydrogenase (NADP+) / methenyltetrahydrofolate cyclohydrolase
MWRLATALRERNSPLRTISDSLHKRFRHDAVSLQLFVPPSSAPAVGVVNALAHNLYVQQGIHRVDVRPCLAGQELEQVRRYQDANPNGVALGCSNQTVFVPTLLQDPNLKATAVAALFRKSPLALVSLAGTTTVRRIAAKQDKVDILQRLFPRANIVSVSSSQANDGLLDGTFDALQIDMTTDFSFLDSLISEHQVRIAPLDGCKDTRLGYGQVIFAPNECLQDTDRNEIVRKFLQATMKGWEMAIRDDPVTTLQSLKEARRLVGAKPHDDDIADLKLLGRINDHVKETFQGDRYGIIDSRRWNEANHWLTNGKDDTTNNSFGLDPTLWQPPAQLLSGNELARCILDDAKASAATFCQTYGRQPALAVITVGDLIRYQDADRRLQLYSNTSSSWFSKAATGLANGFTVKEIQLPASATTDDILSHIYAASKEYDGIQLMWPLPSHVDATRVYNAIDIAKDVDGIHYIGQREIGNANAYPPVTPAGALDLMTEHGVQVAGKLVLVVGRSPIVGSPIAHMLRTEGAVVTVAHTGTGQELLKKLVGTSDMVVTCAGHPGLIPAEWIQGAVVINVGTTFVTEIDSLCSDIEGNIENYASRYSPVPGGVGPLSSPCLLRNTVRAAWNQMKTGGRVESSWKKNSATLTKSFHFENYTSALEYAQRLDRIMDHHANMTLSHRCVNGVDVELEYYTFEADALTEKDYDAAKVADLIYKGNSIRMSDFTYNLKPESIAKYPASPRGSSKLLRVDENGRVTNYKNFSDSIVTLLSGKHVVFNESRVLDARLFVEGPNRTQMELMLLDLGEVDLGESCHESRIRAMIRSDVVKKGDIFKDAVGGAEIEVIAVEECVVLQ